MKKQYPFELYCMIWLCLLALIYSVQTAIQVSVLNPLVIFILSLSFFIYGFKRWHLTLPKVDAFFYVSAVGLFLWVCMSGYIPWRDNDAFMFWMPKAKALSIYGYLPHVDSNDPRTTIHPNYPLGFLGLSAFVHSLLGSFYFRLHQFTIAIQSLLIWLHFYRLFSHHQPSNRQWRFIILTIPQIAIWANGYHDMLWSLGLSMLIIHSFRNEKLSISIPLLVYLSLGKSEAAMFAGLSIPFYLYHKKFVFLLGFIPAICWGLLCSHFQWISNVRLQLTPHQWQVVWAPLWDELKRLLLFQSPSGTTSALLLASFFVINKLRPVEWIYPLSAFAVLLFVYCFSILDPAWHIHFSLSRVIVFPLMLILLISLERCKKIDISL